MQASRFCSSYSAPTRVYEPEPAGQNKKRVPDERVAEPSNVVQTSQSVLKKAKEDVECMVVSPPQRRIFKIEKAVEVDGDYEDVVEQEPSNKTKKREREPQHQRELEAEEKELGDIITKMEKVSIQTHEVLNQVGEVKGALTLFQKSIAVEIDPDASLDMSDEELVRITTRAGDFTRLTIFQSRSITDSGIIRALMGRRRMYEVNLSACPNVTDWTLSALGGNCPLLAKLSVVKCPITDEGIEQLAPKCKGLRVVNLDWCFNLTDKTLLALAQHCPNLREFTTAECGQYSLAGFKALLAGCPMLEKLELWGCQQVNDEWVQALVESKCAIKELDLTGCRKVTQSALDSLCERFEGIAIES